MDSQNVISDMKKKPLPRKDDALLALEMDEELAHRGLGRQMQDGTRPSRMPHQEPLPPEKPLS